MFNCRRGGRGVIMRWNVLYLMSAAYVVLLVMFAAMAFTKDLTAVDAWNMLEAPLMALIGGTLAISKDLIAGDDSPSEDTNNLQDKEAEANQEETPGEKQQQ